jgi:hypothetical protein
MSQYLDDATPLNEETTTDDYAIREVLFSSTPGNEIQIDFGKTPQLITEDNQSTFRILKLATDGLWDIVVAIEREKGKQITEKNHTQRCSDKDVNNDPTPSLPSLT